jgi:hypothetical protein
MAEHVGGGNKPTVPLYSLARRYAAKCRVLLPDVTAPALGHRLWLWLSHQLWLQLWLWLRLRHVTAGHVRGGNIPTAPLYSLAQRYAAQCPVPLHVRLRLRLRLGHRSPRLTIDARLLAPPHSGFD